MYNHRILSFLAFTSTFWVVSMISSLVAWMIVGMYNSSTSPQGTGRTVRNAGGVDDQASDPIKAEDDDDESFDAFSTEDLSDTQRTFPTLGRQMPLRFPGRSSDGVKKEETEEEQLERTAGVQPLIAEADDEDDFVERRAGRTDSGLGTSLDDEASRRNGVQRRRSRLFGGGGR